MPSSSIPCTIQAGNALSDPVDCSQANNITAIGMPSDWTPALLSFQFSPDGVNYFDVFDNSANELAINVVAGSYVSLIDPAPTLGKCFVKLRSGARNGPIAQAQQRSFVLIVN